MADSDPVENDEIPSAMEVEEPSEAAESDSSNNSADSSDEDDGEDEKLESLVTELESSVSSLMVIFLYRHVLGKCSSELTERTAHLLFDVMGVELWLARH